MDSLLAVVVAAFGGGGGGGDGAAAGGNVDAPLSEVVELPAEDEVVPATNTGVENEPSSSM